MCIRIGRGALGLAAVLYFVLATSLSRDTDADARDADARSRYLGRDAVAVTPLRPGGIVEVGGERVEVQTEGEFIAAGSMVRIVAMDRRRFFVRMADAEPAASDGQKP